MNEPAQPTRRQIVRDATRLLILGGLSGAAGWLVAGGRVSFSADSAPGGPCRDCSAREACGAVSRGDRAAVEACPFGQGGNTKQAPQE